MKITIDTNIVLDVLAKREPFFEQSRAVLQQITLGNADGTLTANSITDIYYILRKLLDRDTLRTALRNLMELLEILEVNADSCLCALNLSMTDYEDALLAHCAKKAKADYIVTRNIKDFKESPVPAISPDELLERLENE